MEHVTTKSRRFSLILAAGLTLFVTLCGLRMIRPVNGQDTNAGGQPDHTVLLTNIEFKPNRLKVKAGDTIRFTNRDKFDHDVYLVRTANRNDVITPTTTIHAGQSVTVTVDQEGLFTLYCTIHGGMTGMITTTDTFELTEEEKKRAAAMKVVPPIVKIGEEIYWGRGQCHRCHMMEERGDGLRGPNHQDLGFRAAARAKKLGLKSATEYITQSIMEPSAHIVEGYSDDMPKVYQPPLNLGEEEIKALVAYLQSQGGEVDTWSININKQTLETKLAESPFTHASSLRGRKVFDSMGCGSCHTVGERESVSIAPELTAIGTFRNWTWLLQAVTDPNAEIGANWIEATVYLKPGVFIESDQPTEEEYTFDEGDFDFEEDAGEEATNGMGAKLADARAEMLKLQERIQKLEQENPASEPEETRLPPENFGPSANDKSAQSGKSDENNKPPADLEYGETITSVLRKDGADEVILLLKGDRLLTIPRDQIAHVEVLTKSRMATNYGELMTFQQIADLITYLESLKGETSAAKKDIPNQSPTAKMSTNGAS